MVKMEKKEQVSAWVQNKVKTKNNYNFDFDVLVNVI